MAEGLDIPRYMMEEITREFSAMRHLPKGGKIVLTVEINVGIGGTVNDIDIDSRVKRKIKHG